MSRAHFLQPHQIKTMGDPRLACATFNLRRSDADEGTPHAWEKRLPAAAAFFARHRPAFVGVQEGLHEQLAELLASPALGGRYACVGQGREGGEAGEYSAILYDREQLELAVPAAGEAASEGTQWLSPEPGVPGSVGWGAMCPRVVTWARFSTRQRAAAPGATTFTACNTHLDHASPEARLQGSLAISRLLERVAAPGEPVLLVGDFNCTAASAAYRWWAGEGGMRDAFVEAGSVHSNGARGTFHAFKGLRASTQVRWRCALDAFFACSSMGAHRRRGALCCGGCCSSCCWLRPTTGTSHNLDWILFRGGSSRQAGGASVLTPLGCTIDVTSSADGTTFPSDHFPVVAEFELARAGPRVKQPAPSSSRDVVVRQ